MPGRVQDEVPHEIWLQIFESVPVTADLRAVVLTCKTFYLCAIRSLNSRLIWSDPATLVQSLDSWETADLGMINAVRSIACNISTIPNFPSAKFIDVDGGFRQVAPPPIHRGLYDSPLLKSYLFYNLGDRLTFASNRLYDKMAQRIRTFTNVRSLILKDCILSDHMYATIHALPNLRTLHLELCLSPGRARFLPRDHSILPMTELTILNLRRRVTNMNNFNWMANVGHALADVDDDVVHVLDLARAQNLRVLRIDSTADVLSRVFCVWNAANTGYTFNTPANLQELYIERKKPLRMESQPQLPNEQFFPDRALYAVFSRCPTIHTLSISQQFPRHTTLPEQSLPHLRNLEGLSEVVLVAMESKPLQAVSLLLTESPQTSAMEVLGQVARAHPTLKMLALECDTWDEEVMHAVTQLFKELKRLKITYMRSGPEEKDVVSLGPVFLSKLPHLHTFQLHYSNNRPFVARNYLFDETYDSIQQEMKELVIPWSRYCPGLKVAQFSREWRMRKGFAGVGWEVEKVGKDEMEEPESFAY